MATLISEIIKDAYREANLIAAGTEPTATQEEEGLRLLNRYIRALFGNEMGDPLTPAPIGQSGIDFKPESLYYYDTIMNYFVPANVRIIANLDAPKEVNLHPKPEDGQRVAVSDAIGNFDTNTLTLKGNGRFIEGNAVAILDTKNIDVEYFYRADIAQWKLVTDLESTTQSPFPMEFDDLLIVGLAMRLAPRYGTTTTQESLNTYMRTLTKFRSRYGQTDEIRTEQGLIRLPSSRNYLGWAYTDDSFERGTNLGI